jgi:histidinol-phosphatase (PHP family)
MNENLITNFHTHTMLCHHATGMPAEYVRQAQKDGCCELGFSDHCPYPESNDFFWKDIRMTAAQAPVYIEAVKEAARTVSFPVHTGFECEWDKNYASWYSDVLKDELKTDYLILGSHWVTLGNRHVYCQELDSVSELHTYIDQTIDGMQSGLFSFLAHPDIFMGGWKEWDAEAESCLKAVLEAARDCSLPLEINGLGLIKQKVRSRRGLVRQYPVDEFWKLVAQSNVQVICNADAHDPLDVICNARKARDYAARFGITPMESIFQS